MIEIEIKTKCPEEMEIWQFFKENILIPFFAQYGMNFQEKNSQEEKWTNKSAKSKKPSKKTQPKKKSSSKGSSVKTKKETKSSIKQKKSSGKKGNKNV